MGTNKMILLFFLAFYFSCGFYQARILPSDNEEVIVAEQLNNNHNVDGETTIAVNNKYGHVGGGRGNGGEVNGDGSRSPSNQGSNFIPVYAANAHHNRHHGAASSHKSHNQHLVLFATMFFACLCI
ncbi:uncharacterized protein LOC132059217 [Lycium ferocissimum]|uniref:uncharacterized protein LOC132059217 n=1 Tax=Lycium ferocissimum TaxID=112874 RepID=UPI0028161A24|nr:uncharacterized protein LOC132059217 [Lycium ferocissimum]